MQKTARLLNTYNVTKLSSFSIFIGPRILNLLNLKKGVKVRGVQKVVNTETK